MAGKAKSNWSTYGMTSRCHPRLFRDTLLKIKGKITLEQQDLLKRTPFSFLLDMPKVSQSFTRIVALIRRYNANNNAFVVGENINLIFSANEFCIITGLHLKGQPIDIDGKFSSVTVNRLFNGKNGNVSRKNIINLLNSLVGTENSEDFVRVFILFVFNCLLFPMGNSKNPSFLNVYVDELEAIGEYAWGAAVHEFLLQELKKAAVLKNNGSQISLNGCTIGLMMWFYERVPGFGKKRSLYTYPRWYNWEASYVSADCTLADREIAQVTSVLSILPRRCELKLLEPIAIPSAPLNENTEETIMRRTKTRRTRRKRREVKRAVIDEEESDEEGVDAAGGAEEDDDEEGEEEEEEEAAVDGGVQAEVELEEVAGVLAKEAAMDEQEEGKDEEIEKEGEGDDEEIEKEGEGDDEVGADGVCEDEEIEDEEVEDAEGEDEVGAEEEGEAVIPTSSITRTVRGRQDRQKKRDPAFTTPGTSDKKKRKKRRSDCGEDEPNIADEWYRPYIGKTEFVGKEKVTQKQRDVIGHYLQSNLIGLKVWENELCEVDSKSFYMLLFGGLTSSSIIDAYGDSMTRSVEGGHRVFVIPSFLQVEVFMKATSITKNAKINEGLLREMTNSLSKSALTWLRKLDFNILTMIDYIVAPIYKQNHWAVLIYKGHDIKFYLRDSLISNQMKWAARTFARFLSTFWASTYGYEVKTIQVYGEYTRAQKSDGVDCGIHAAMSMHRYIFGPIGNEKYLDNVDVELYRASMAYRLLTDPRNGLMKRMD